MWVGLWSFVATVMGIGVLMLIVARLRARPPALREALPECRIAELEPGRYRVCGRIVPMQTSPSAVDGVDCVYIERAEYQTVGTGVPLLREVEHRAITHPFYLEDESGRIVVDPARTLIECARLTEDGGLTVERRLRAGEEVSLDATFALGEASDEEDRGPYRASARRFHPKPDELGPPRLSHVTDADFVRLPIDGVSGFLGGAGAILLLTGGLLAFIVTFIT